MCEFVSHGAPGIVFEEVQNNIVAGLAVKKECRRGYWLSVVEGSDLGVLSVRLESDDVQWFGHVHPCFH